ncbi:DNA-binding response regulator [Alicyclobacillus sp. SO9]|uniref:DNA-binding response regulator n=1 Tax=Alicyclobacillus sp. SO9 TaxID=2665646 RepID=UPI0018E6F286|nr:DNA-binding response regulator [Alicyclobacillus sp. SO9]QQE78858.1 DNA-binding response regulator [Alicyclobacillus sp. SO9]
MDFHNSYDNLLSRQKQSIDAEVVISRKSSSQHAERAFLRNVWWPAFQNFDGLHPEYEILDFNEGRRHIDFAYIQPHFRVAIEIDGIGPHWRDISQERFSDHCNRQNHLIIDGWYVLRFTYMDVQHRPRLCQRTIQQLLGRLSGDAASAVNQLPLIDREIVRFVLGRPFPVTVAETAAHIQLKRHATIRHLKLLTDSGWLVPASGTRRVRTYRIHPSYADVRL